GLMVALALHRYPTRLNILIQLLVMTPIMLPSVFLGLALLVMYSRIGLASTPWGLFAGHVMMVTPVTLSLIAWSLAAGWGFAFMMSFGSLEVSLFLSTPTMVTLPVKIYSALEWSPLDP